MRHVNQLTLRGLQPWVERQLRDLARREGLSLNQAALRLLEKATGAVARQDDRIGNSLDRFIGTWSTEEADALLDSIQSCEQIDPELWD